MQLYLKQKFISLGDKYNIFNEKDEVEYTVKSRIFSPFRHKKTLLDKKGNPIMVIKRKILDILPNYLIETPDGKLITRMRKNFSFKANFSFFDCEGHNYRIAGDFFAWNYDLYDGEELICSTKKKIIHIVDSYYMNVIKDEEAPFAIACIIAIDNLYHNGSRSGNR